MASPVKNCPNYTSPLEFTLEEEAASARVVMKLARDMIYLIMGRLYSPKWMNFRETSKRPLTPAKIVMDKLPKFCPYSNKQKQKN